MAEAIVLRSVKGSPLTHTEMDNNFINPFRNLIDGLITSNAADADHDISVSAGVFTDSTNARTFETTSAIVKQIDVNWAEGTAAGGFPSGLTLTADTWYHFFMIAKTDGTVDAGWDTSLVATNLLADATGYTLFRRVASHISDSSSNIESFTQRGDVFNWTTVTNVAQTAGGTAAILLTIQTPLGLEIPAHMVMENIDSSATSSTSWLTTSPNDTDSTPNSQYRDGVTVTGVENMANGKTVVTNTSSQVRVRKTASTADHITRLMIYAYTDIRGKE